MPAILPVPDEPWITRVDRVVPWEQRVAGLEAAGHAARVAGRRREAAIAFNDAGLAATDGGLLDQAIPLFALAAAELAGAGNPFDAAAVEANAARAMSRVGQLSVARDRYAAALGWIADARETQSVEPAAIDLREADICTNLGVLLRRQGEIIRAAQEYGRAQQLFARHRQDNDVLDIECNLAVLDVRSGDLPAARARLTAIRDRPVSEIGAGARARATTTLATVAGQEGRFAEAAALLDEAYPVYVEFGLPRELAEVVTNRGYIHLHTGDLTAARHDLELAEVMFERMRMALDRARVLGGLGNLELRLGEAVAAVERYTVALAVFEHLELDREIARTVVNLAVAHVVAQDWESAVAFASAATELYADAPSLIADAVAAEHNLGVALAGAGRWRDARSHYVRARIGYRRLGQRREAAEVDMNLAGVAAAHGLTRAARRRYRRAADDLRDLGLWPQLARCEFALGITWPRGSRERTTRVVPAWLALDEHRFSLHGPAERARWRTTLASPAAAAFDAVAADPLLLAELIEHARAVGGIAGAPPPVPGLLGFDSRSDSEVIEPAMNPPARINCGWAPRTDVHVREAERIRAIGSGIPPSGGRTTAHVATTLRAGA